MSDFKVPKLPVRAHSSKPTPHQEPEDTAPLTNVISVNDLSTDSTKISDERDTSTKNEEMAADSSEHGDTKTNTVNDTTIKQGDTSDLSLQYAELEKSHDQSHDKQNYQETPPPELPYHEPTWSGQPLTPHHLSVIKNGVEIDSVNISDLSFCIFGRLPSCHVHLEHPSISRYHAILQHRPTSASNVPESTLFSTNPHEAGYYVYDLGSTHGTFLNKNKIQPRCYYRVRIGQTIRFGGSSRIFVLDQSLDSSQEIVEAEAEAERQEIQLKQEEYQKLVAQAEAERKRQEQDKEDMGVTWGMMMDDMVEGTEIIGEMDIDPEREAYYISDPKKALKKFFDREGLELEYETEESDSKTQIVKVRLPLETLSGEPIYAQATVQGKKKEAVVQCALEACRMLDAEGVLRHSMKSYKRKQRDWEENDYYDSDEDNFLDRTGDVDRKRKVRMRKAGKLEESVETFESLQFKLKTIEEELKELHKKLTKSKQVSSMSGGAEDSLDTFMKNISGRIDKQKQSEIKLRIHQLNKEETNLRKLIKVAEPYRLPGSSVLHNTDKLQSTVSSTSEKKDSNTMINDEPSVLHSTSTDSSVIQRQYEDKLPSVSCSSSSTTATTSSPPSSSPNLSSPHLSPDRTGYSRLEKNQLQPKKRKLIGPSLPARRKRSQSTEEKNEELSWEGEADKEYASWLPPEDQTGDGRTKLNEKFGY